MVSFMAKLIPIYNDLNQTLITTINTVFCSTLADNFIKSHATDYLTSALILVNAVDIDQEHIATIGNIVIQMLQWRTELFNFLVNIWAKKTIVIFL